MAIGLEKLAISIAPSIVSATVDSVGDVAQSFADIFQTASIGEAVSPDKSLESDIHSDIKERLAELGLPEDTPFQIEVSASGKLWIEANPRLRGQIENALLDDEGLRQRLQNYASQHSLPDQAFRLHWPPESGIE